MLISRLSETEKGLWRHYLEPQLQGEEPKSEMHTNAANPVELRQTSNCDNIRSRRWRGSTLSSIRRGLSSVEGPVSRFIDAGVQEQLGLFGGCTATHLTQVLLPACLGLAGDRAWYSRPVVCVWPMWPHAWLHQNKTSTPLGLTAARLLHTFDHPWPWQEQTPGCCEQRQLIGQTLHSSRQEHKWY